MDCDVRFLQELLLFNMNIDLIVHTAFTRGPF